ncbi:PREDICTED: uncharacterized protein LOC102009952 [Chinchilla lanigera]|uniref:uncharacterized protein LOC102009952 n=1 Tax=Chinchilla lanigera TaxID=34839 RepID=UPI000695D5F8|nr:PREDICTED: uncharacterized protein LOC102009952 [Chinchilla lanigera]
MSSPMERDAFSRHPSSPPAGCSEQGARARPTRPGTGAGVPLKELRPWSGLPPPHVLSWSRRPRKHFGARTVSRTCPCCDPATRTVTKGREKTKAAAWAGPAPGGGALGPCGSALLTKGEPRWMDRQRREVWIDTARTTVTEIGRYSTGWHFPGRPGLCSSTLEVRPESPGFVFVGSPKET